MEKAEKEKTCIMGVTWEHQKCKLLGGPGACACPLGLLDCIPSILEQQFECLHRSHTSLTFGFWEDNFQRKVGSEFT